MKTLALALATALISSTPVQALPRKLPPIEQCSGDRHFKTFRRRLMESITKRELEDLLPLLAPDVLVDFGGSRGREAFAEKIDNAGDELWMQLGQIVHLGCARSGDARVIPSLALQFEPDAGDLTDVMVALPGAKLRKTGEWDSPVVATLEWDVVTGVDTHSDFQTGVRLADGREGWVADADMYSPLGYRLYIERRKGVWIVTSLVAGD